MNLSEFWAKTDPYQSVLTHGTTVGLVCRFLFSKYLQSGVRKLLCETSSMKEERLSRFCGYLASLHDIGKVSYSFQAADAATKEKMDMEGLTPSFVGKGPFRHEKTTAVIMKALWSEAGCHKREYGDYTELLAAHHQGKSGENDKIRDIWLPFYREYEARMRETFLDSEKPYFPVPSSEKKGAFQAVLLGLLILSDWIASSELFSQAEQWTTTGVLTETVQSKAETFLSESGMAAAGAIGGVHFRDVWPNIPEGCERELQKKTEELFSSNDRYLLVLMEAPMGEGKTEAGIYAAARMAEQWGRNGFYVALPTSATSNQMADRMTDFLRLHDIPDSVRLLHSLSWMYESATPDVYRSEEEEQIRKWTAPKRRGLLLPYAVGTVDQAMMAAMMIKYGVLRIIGLSGKVLVIDEVHAYDVYMQSILKDLLSWCKALQIPVVLLSATLPKDKKKELLSVYGASCQSGEYPAITAVAENGSTEILPFRNVAMRNEYRIDLAPVLGSPERIALLATKALTEGGCACILMNTVRQAQDVYRCLKDSGFSGELLLFHSRFPVERRAEIEEQCITLFGKNKTHRPRKAILVATQVVEQSLDVDFDYMLSAVAPIDLLLQRMGREHRHADTIRPENLKCPRFTVLIPDDDSFGSDKYVYPPPLLNQSVHLLQGREIIRIPEDMAELVEQGYDPAAAPQEELDSWLEMLMTDRMSAAESLKYLLGSPDKKFASLHRQDAFDDLESGDYLSAKTRLSEPTVRIALLDDDLYGIVSAGSERDSFLCTNPEIGKAVMLRSCSMSKRQYQKAIEGHEIKPILGKGLLSELLLLPEDNGCLYADKQLGIIRKGEFA